MASEEQNRTARWAGRNADLREVKFETQGFASNVKVPSVGTANAMWSQTKRTMAALVPTPSRGQ